MTSPLARARTFRAFAVSLSSRSRLNVVASAMGLMSGTGIISPSVALTTCMAEWYPQYCAWCSACAAARAAVAAAASAASRRPRAWRVLRAGGVCMTRRASRL